MERSFDRRKFLKASGLVAASALGAATLASCAPSKTSDNNQALPTSGEIAWDKLCRNRERHRTDGRAQSCC